MVTIDAFLKGVSFFAAARETGKKKYAKLGLACLSKIKTWMEKGNPNISHYRAFLEAELMAYKGKLEAAVYQYKQAIRLATRTGFQQDAALASERLGVLHLYKMKDREGAEFYLRQAIKCWGSWGSRAKVQHLRQMYPSILSEGSLARQDTPPTCVLTRVSTQTQNTRFDDPVTWMRMPVSRKSSVVSALTSR